MKTALLAAALLLPLAATAQDQGAMSPDPNTNNHNNPRNPIPQGERTTPFGFGQPREGRFVQEKDKVDAQTGAQPTDRQGAANETAPPETPGVETNQTPSRTDTGSPRATQPHENAERAPAKKKSKKSREQLRKERRQGLKKAPAAPADKELPAVSEPGKDGALIDDVPPQDVPHD